jgi:glycerol-3-phosphate dehydrogenase
VTTRGIPSDIEQIRFDVIVVGAGINGTGIARDAAMRGLNVLLLDKTDLAAGTTSWSTRLVHGGLRYLEYREVGLVRESLRERERLLRNAPHLVTPIPMLLPFYGHNKRGPWTIRAGMVAYDLLSFDKSLDHHHMLDREETLRRAPGLDRRDLHGSALFYDAQATYAERLTVENALSARDHGTTVLTYARVDRLLTDGAAVRGVEVTDQLGGGTFQAQGRVVVNVAGPWVDSVLAGLGGPMQRMIGGTKGSHLVVDPFPGAPADALYFEARADGRAVLIVPWNGRNLIGSTDIRYDGDLDDVRTDDQEIDYLLTETNSLIPTAGLNRDAILYTYAGVRPLPYQPTGAEGGITRRHIIHDHAPAIRGLLTIVGGKLTTYRNLAEQTVDQIYKRLGSKPPRCETAHIPLPGAAGVSFDSFKRRFVAESGLPVAAAERLIRVYGARAPRILEIAADEPMLREAFCDETGAIGAEVVCAIRDEMAQTLTDILFRRTMVGLGSRLGLGADEAAATVARRALGWGPERATREVAAYRAFATHLRPPPK